MVGRQVVSSNRWASGCERCCLRKLKWMVPKEYRWWSCSLASLGKHICTWTYTDMGKMFKLCTLPSFDLQFTQNIFSFSFQDLPEFLRNGKMVQLQPAWPLPLTLLNSYCVISKHIFLFPWESLSVGDISPLSSHISDPFISAFVPHHLDRAVWRIGWGSAGVHLLPQIARPPSRDKVGLPFEKRPELLP